MQSIKQPAIVREQASDATVVDRSHDSLVLRIIVPAALAMAVVLLASALLMYLVFDRQVARKVEAQAVYVQNMISNETALLASIMAAALEVIGDDQQLRDNLQHHDREALMNNANPLFAKLREEQLVTHFYFNAPDRRNILRVHDPFRHGDIIERHTTLKADQTKAVVWGLEFGKYGTFTLRVVKPLLNEGEVIGFIELGAEIDHVLKHVERSIDGRILISLNKALVERKDWELGKITHGLRGDWELFQERIVLEPLNGWANSRSLYTIVSSHLAGENRVTISGDSYHLQPIALRDVTDQPVGEILLLLDTSSDILGMQQAIFWLLLSGSLVSIVTGVFLFSVARVIKRKLMSSRQALVNMNRELDRMAHYDVLTELPNRALFQDRLNHALIESQRNQSMLVLLYLDLDRFKPINDSLGHLRGDLLLRKVAERLEGAVRAVDTVARLGGDEFIVLLQGLHSSKEVILIGTRVASSIINVLEEPFDLDGYEAKISTTIGIAVFPTDGIAPAALMQNVDTALYHAKARGRGQFAFYEPHMNAEAEERLRMEGQLQRALERNELELHFQPTVSPENDRVEVVEALIRWRHPERGLLGANQFMPLAEGTGLIILIGKWVLREAAKVARGWPVEASQHIKLAVNLSVEQLKQKGLVQDLCAVFNETGLAPGQLVLEFTEGSFMNGHGCVPKQLERLHDLGVELAIDDFGTSYSSLARLKSLPVSTLKIDRSLISEIPDKESGARIVETIIGMCRSLHLRVIAEGVETQEQVEFLRQHRCDLAQGFWFMRPVPVDVLIAYLGKHPQQAA